MIRSAVIKVKASPNSDVEIENMDQKITKISYCWLEKQLKGYLDVRDYQD